MLKYVLDWLIDTKTGCLWAPGKSLILTVSVTEHFCSTPPTVSPMAHSIVSERCMVSWIRMSLGDAWMSLSTSAWVAVLSVVDSTHEVQQQRMHGRRIAAQSVEERGCRCCWRRATTSAWWHGGDGCEQVGDVKNTLLSIVTRMNTRVNDANESLYSRWNLIFDYISRSAG